MQEQAAVAGTVTRRLVLRRPAADDVAELFAIYSHPEVWRHDPVTRHERVEQTERLVQRWLTGWRRGGLGIWTARAAAGADAGVEAGALVGIGGCSLRDDVAWNLGYRLAPQFWGRGYAQEIVAAGVAAARVLRPDLAVTAYLLEGNERSRRTAERAGLRRVWRGPDAGNPDPEAIALLYADRDLDDALVRTLTTD